MNSKEYEKLAYSICGDFKELKNSSELLAYSIETEYGNGNGNKLSKMIVDVFEEKYNAAISK